MPMSPERDRRSMRSPNRGLGRGPRGPPAPYKVLCVSALHPKASDDVVRDTLYREYKKYGDISVRVMHEPDERVAYVYFRNFEDARDAKHSKSRIILFDKPAIVEPVFERSSEPAPYRPRPRSITPPPDNYRGGGGYRSRSPGMDYRDRGPRDYRDDGYMHGGGGRDYHHRDPPPRGGGGSRGGGYGGGGGGSYGGGGRGQRENKKDKFPNYLNHIPPEDDPLATRTLFTGNLELNITDEEMRRIFGRYGRLVDIDIKRPPPGTGNAYAFIRYENLDQAHRAKVELSGQYIGKFQCKIGYGKVNATPKVWVGGLGSWCSSSLLEREFDRFGAIQNIGYRKGDTHATILYESIDAAQAAVQEMRGFPLGGPDKRLRMDYSDMDDDPGRSAGGGGGGSGGRGRDEPMDYGRGGGRYRGRGGGGRGGYGREDSWSMKRPAEEPLDRPARMPRRSLSPEGDGKRFSELGSVRSIAELSKKSDKVWDGGLILKNSLFPTKLHLIEGDGYIANSLKDENDKCNLKITQRLRLDQTKLDDVTKRMNSASNHAIFLGVSNNNAAEPEPSDNPDIQSRPLRNLVSYLKQKEAAGVISLCNRESDVTGVLYCFPPCPYSIEMLRRAAPSLADEKDDHLVMIVVCGAGGQ